MSVRSCWEKPTRRLWLRRILGLLPYCQVMPRPKRPSPASLCDDWPNAVCTDPAAEKVRLLAVRVLAAMGTLSQRTVATKADVDYSALSDLLAGRSWPDSRTIANLEVGLNRALWPPHKRA
jgi:hypothetical protein